MKTIKIFLSIIITSFVYGQTEDPTFLQVQIGDEEDFASTGDAWRSCDEVPCIPTFVCIMRKISCLSNICPDLPPIPLCVPGDPKNDCSSMNCADGYKCIYVEQICKKAPCYPQPLCIAYTALTDTVDNATTPMIPTEPNLNITLTPPTLPPTVTPTVPTIVTPSPQPYEDEPYTHTYDLITTSPDPDCQHESHVKSGNSKANAKSKSQLKSPQASIQTLKKINTKVHRPAPPPIHPNSRQKPHTSSISFVFTDVPPEALLSLRATYGAQQRSQLRNVLLPSPCSSIKCNTGQKCEVISQTMAMCIYTSLDDESKNININRRIQSKAVSLTSKMSNKRSEATSKQLRFYLSKIDCLLKGGCPNSSNHSKVPVRSLSKPPNKHQARLLPTKLNTRKRNNLSRVSLNEQKTTKHPCTSLVCIRGYCIVKDGKPQCIPLSQNEKKTKLESFSN